MNIQTFCFSSESMQLLCSRNVNQKYLMIFHWFPKHLLCTDYENIKLLYIYIYIYDRDAEKLSLKNFIMECKGDVLY